MKVEVLNTGSELLLGQVTNTHLPYFGERLFPLGLRIERQVTVPDGSAIRPALWEAFGRCDVLLVTGGLGPTTDDITREICAELLGRRLVEDASVWTAIENRLRNRGIPVQERMRRQALVPEGATVLPNANGTAPGLYLPATVNPSWSTPHVFLLPGPPRELKPMFEESVLPLLRSLAGGLEERECRTYHVVGMGESLVEVAIGLEIYARGDIEVGYCARPNEVDLRLIGVRSSLDEVEPRVLAAIGRHLVSRRGEPIETVVVNGLRERGMTVSTAESCTGGLLAHRLTNVPGASEVFPAGYVVYANSAKMRDIGVPESMLALHGAVSEPVARALAEGVRNRTGTDFGIGITGIAGPGGGSAEKPVGTVFFALAERGRPTEVWQRTIVSDRETFKQLVTQTVLDHLRLRLL